MLHSVCDRELSSQGSCRALFQRIVPQDPPKSPSKDAAAARRARPGRDSSGAESARLQLPPATRNTQEVQPSCQRAVVHHLRMEPRSSLPGRSGTVPLKDHRYEEGIPCHAATAAAPRSSRRDSEGGRPPGSRPLGERGRAPAENQQADPASHLEGHPRHHPGDGGPPRAYTWLRRSLAGGVPGDGRRGRL